MVAPLHGLPTAFTQMEARSLCSLAPICSAESNCSTTSESPRQRPALSQKQTVSHMYVLIDSERLAEKDSIKGPLETQ